MVSTIAYGMGLDKSNVRNVIYFSPANDFEHYYHDIGRAGRDNLRSKCFMSYDRKIKCVQFKSYISKI